MRVKIHNRMSEATGLRVMGHSHGPLKARRVVIDRTIESGERLVVRLPVKLRRDKAAKLRVTTRPSGAFMARADVQRVQVRPVR